MGPLLRMKRRHSTAKGAETARAKQAMQLVLAKGLPLQDALRASAAARKAL